MRMLYLAVGAFLVLVVPAIYFLTPGQVEHSQTLSFPEKLPVRLLLPDEVAQEMNRTIIYAEDNETKVRADVEFVDGKTGYINYRPDGTMSSFGVFYPPDDGGLKTVMMEAEFEDNGLHYLWEKHYFEDGVVRRSGVRLASGNYEVQEFYQGGTVLAGKFVFDNDGGNVESTHFYPTGVMSKLVVTKKHYGTETTNFSENGLKLTFHFENTNGKEYVLEEYREDGKTPKIRFEQKAQGAMMATSYNVWGYYYNDDGSLNHIRKISRHYMTVFFPDENGDTIFRQRFEHKTPDTEDMTIDADQWVFESVQFGEEADFIEKT